MALLVNTSLDNLGRIINIANKTQQLGLVNFKSVDDACAWILPDDYIFTALKIHDNLTEYDHYNFKGRPEQDRKSGDVNQTINSILQSYQIRVEYLSKNDELDRVFPGLYVMGADSKLDENEKIEHREHVLSTGGTPEEADERWKIWKEYVAGSQKAKVELERKELMSAEDALDEFFDRVASNAETNRTISILFLAADPSDTSRLRLGEEFREIQEKLKMAKLHSQFKLELPQLSVRAVDISQALLDTQSQIVHFSGHGVPEGALCFEDLVGETHTIQPDTLAALFEQFAKQVNCVVLNACYSEVQANAIAKHIDYAIGMNQAIGDKAAIAFAVGFYQALGAGRTIEEAYKLGCVQISLQNIPEHSTPILIKKGQEKALGMNIELGSQLSSDGVSVRNEITNDYNGPKSSHSPPPYLTLKLIGNMGQHVDEITITQTNNNQDFRFGIALLNIVEESDPTEKIDIRVECSWVGNSIFSSPQFNTDRYGRTTPGWQATRQLIQQDMQPYPAVLAFHGSGDDRCAYGHPLEWHRFVFTVAERMIGRFILSYTISSTNPKGEYKGQMAIIMTPETSLCANR